MAYNVIALFLFYAYESRLKGTSKIFYFLLNIERSIIEYNQRTMEVLKASKSYNSNKFIIKPKGSVAHLKSETAESDSSLSCSDQQVDLFLQQLVDKSKRLKDLLQEKSITNEEEFYEKYLFKSICLKTMIKTVIEKMLNERRLGKNLKGLNKSNMVEIENCIWKSLLREVELYTNEKEFNRGKEELQATLAKRKQEILQELQKLRVRSRPSKPKPTSSLPN